MDERFWTGLFSLLSGIIGGGGIVKLYQLWRRGKTTATKDAKTSQEFINVQFQELAEERRRASEQQMKRADQFQQDLDDLRKKYAEVTAEKIALEMRLNLAYETCKDCDLRLLWQKSG